MHKKVPYLTQLHWQRAPWDSQVILGEISVATQKALILRREHSRHQQENMETLHTWFIQVRNNPRCAMIRSERRREPEMNGYKWNVIAAKIFGLTLEGFLEVHHIQSTSSARPQTAGSLSLFDSRAGSPNKTTTLSEICGAWLLGQH